MPDPWYAYISNSGSLQVIELTEHEAYKMKYDLPNISHIKILIGPFQARDKDAAWVYVKGKLAVRDVLQKLKI